MQRAYSTSRASSMIEMLGVMVVILIFVGMAAVSAVRTKSIEADAQARFYSAVLQTYMTEYGIKQKDYTAWNNRVNLYKSATSAAKSSALRDLITLLTSSGDPLLGPSSGAKGPLVSALDGYTLNFKSSPLSAFEVTRDGLENGLKIYPLE